MLQFPPLEEKEEKSRSLSNKTHDRRKRQKVVRDDEWVDNIRTIVQRDYFPIDEDSEGKESDAGKKPRLDDYVSTHINEDSVAFDMLQERAEKEHAAMFSNKKSFLRLTDVPSTELIKSSSSSIRKEIHPKSTRFPKESDKSREPKSMLSKQSRNLKTLVPSASQHRRVLSSAGKALVAKLRRTRNEKM